MATTYCTPEELASELGIDDSDDDSKLGTAITAASRQIDGHCGRRFYQDTTVADREFFPESPICVDLLNQPDAGPSTEISTTTGLIVKTDTDGDGTFETTLTIGTDFILLPRNAAVNATGFSEIVSVDGEFPVLSNGRAGVFVTAKFGWPSVPGDVKKACLIQAAQLFKAKDAVGGAAAAEFVSMTRAPIDPMARSLLAPFQKPVHG